MDEHLACAGAPTDNCIEAKGEDWELRTGVLVVPSEATAGTRTNGGVPAAGREKLPARVASELGRAATMLVVRGNTVEPHVNACRTDGMFGMVGVNVGVMAGVLATNGELTTGTPGNLSGDWGKTDACGATVR